ncbi:Bifunctional solanapyrone synthase [Fusarium albosuccineum]|uniref:Bifunctional solanapyrone synthase n=1 Tax=Fusarium albosuccineum TaxID=1237068 RepID=A0A8H4L6D8_9HYPO|nr:Bifunctional solanapyrone synthase [Fusarium albosuccineum]
MPSTSATAVDLFSATFPGKVTTPDSATEYEAENARPWSQKCCVPAAAYVHPDTASEVAEALKIVKGTGCKFAIRTSGHNPNLGFSSIDQTGVVLDLRRLNSKELVQENIARLGAGNTWGEVYEWLEKQELSVIGGRDPTVGLAGFLLGGGMGAFPNLHGLGTDNIKGFEVVLADGTIVNANLGSNADLYKALKGGATNFVQYTISLYNPEDYIGIIDATVQVQKSMETDPKIGLFTNFNAGFVAVILLYADQPTEPIEAFRPFYNLNSILTVALPTTNGTLLSLAQAMGHDQGPKNRTIGTVTTKVSQDLYADVYKAWLEISQTLPEGAVLHHTIQPIGTACIRAAKNNGGNIMGLEEIPQCWWVFTCEWIKGACEDSVAEKAVETIVQKAETSAKEKGLLLDFLAMNFAGAFQKTLRGYGEESVKEMLETAAKYDADRVFQDLQNNGFLLWNNV